MSNQNIGSLGQSSIAEVDSSPNLRESTPSNVSIDEANPLFERVCEVFMKAKEERQENDIQAVVEAIKTIKFFQDLKREDVDFDDFLVTIYEVLNHEHFHKQEAVFHFGERGTKFYVIIKGSVDVYVPKSREEVEKSLVEKKERPDGHWKRRLSRFRNSTPQEAAAPEKNSNGNGSVSNRESMRQGSPVGKRKEVISSQFSTEIQKPSITRRQSRQEARENARELEMFTGLDEKGMYVEEGILRFKKVRRLNVGDTFGEVALSSEMARSATVIASKDLQVLTLSKTAYKKIFEYLERNLKQKWRFFSEITENSSQETVLGFCYGFKEKSFRYGQTLFHQGQFPQNIFIIRDGEIQILKYEEQGNSSTTDNLKHLRKKKKTLVEKRIVNLGPYNLVGEGAALLDQKYDYTARSVSNETVAYVLPIQEFERLRLKYADIWKKVLEKHETKNKHWERRESNVTHVQDKIEEDRQIRMRSNSFKSPATARDESFDSITVNKNEDDDRESLLSRRKNGYKLPLKIFPQQKASDSGEKPQKMSPYSSERLSSFCYEDQSEVELTQRENPEPVSARLGPTASFNGAKAIPGIVESKFKVMQKKTLQAKDPESAEGLLSLSKQPSTSTPKKLFEIKSGALSERKIAASAAKKDQSVSFSQTHRHFLPYKLESIKGKGNMNSLQLEGVSSGSKQEIDIPTIPTQRGKNTMVINTSRSLASNKKSLKLGDSPPLKDFGAYQFQFKTEEQQEIKSARQQGSASYLPNLQQVTSGSIMSSSRGYKSARTFQTTTKSQFIKNSDYLISESDADLLTIELGGPHKSKKEQNASLCMNTFKTADQVPQLSNIFKRIGNIVAPVENLKELQKIPTSYLGKITQAKAKSKTIFPSHHNMFRMKPDKLHLLANSYKFDMMSPSGIRAKR